MDRDFLAEYLKKKNYWWESGKVDGIDSGISRKDYVEKMLPVLKLERIVCLSGIRRAGKTNNSFQF